MLPTWFRRVKADTSVTTEKKPTGKHICSRCKHSWDTEAEYLDHRCDAADRMTPRDYRFARRD